MKTTINPFFNPQSAYSKPSFTYPGAALFEHRTVEVFKNPAGSWDYLLEGVTITQRAGFNRTDAVHVINEMLDGNSPCCDAVAEHVIKCGFTPISYEVYGKSEAAQTPN